MPEEQLIYKVCDRNRWEEAVERGVFEGAEIDLADGFIHFSAKHQVVETVTKHFAGKENLVLVAVPASKLGDALKWEPSRGGDLFPHLYDPLPHVARRECRRSAHRVRWQASISFYAVDECLRGTRGAFRLRVTMPNGMSSLGRSFAERKATISSLSPRALRESRASGEVRVKLF